MPELTTDFQSLPEEYQQIIQLAQDTHNISVAPLQLLVGGWSGAVVYLVSVSYNKTKRVEHCILKLDRKGNKARTDEVTRHNTVISKSTPEFAEDHIAELVFDRVEHKSVIAIFYHIAGQSLLKYLPLSKYERQSQLKTIFTETNDILLSGWNVNATFEQAVHPQKVLEKWLGFRLNAGGNIEQFLQTVGQVNPDIEGLLINGHVFLNPLLYARQSDEWGKIRSMDVTTGFIHGDLNTNNILVKFSDDKETLEGYYLIDFALFKDNMPLLYDQRYLEMSYLMLAMSQVSFAKCVDFLTLLAVADSPDPHKVPIELSGVSAVIGSTRSAFAEWVQANHPSLHDDLWGQYWLAGVAAGLTYCHKTGLSNEQRLAGLIYASANLKRFATTFNLPLPTKIESLYDENESVADSPTSSRMKKTKHNLPAQPTPFIGRQAELATVKKLLIRDSQGVRLVTLTGPGGTGKTRLALQTATDVMDHFADGVYFIDLAPIREPEAVLAALARTVGLKELGDRPLIDVLKEHLRTQRMLLLLDNFEQVTSAAPMVMELLQGCPQLRFLVTSREALHLRGENVHPVPTLSLPHYDPKPQSVEQLSQYEAVRLFIDRVQAVKPDFEVTNENAPAVAEICYRLDGLPLAIELAAARIRLFSPQALLERMGGKLQLLRGGARDLPLRQQTLRDTIDWSYELLDANEQKLFALLSIFAGSTFEAVESVAGGISSSSLNEMDIFDALASLVDKSLIRQVEQSAGEPRLLMLETIREYAAERLVQDPEFNAIARQTHASYFANFAQHLWERLISDARESALKEMESDLENVRISWRYWVEEKDLEQLGKLANSLWLLHDVQGWYHATVSLTNDLLNVLAFAPSTPERAQQQIMLELSLARALAATKGYTEEVEQAYARALQLCENAGDIPQVFPVLRGLASFYILRTEHEKAVQMGERLMQLAEHLDDKDMKVEGHMILGYNLAFLGNPQIGLEHLEKAIAMYDVNHQHVRRFGIGINPGVTSRTVSALFYWMLGYPDQAYKRAADAIALARKLNHPYSITYALFHSGLLNIWLQNYEIARDNAQEVLELAETYGFQIWSAVGSCLLGAALVGMGSSDKSLTLIDQGIQAYQGLKTPPVFWPLLLHLCAGAYSMAARSEDGIRLMNEAIDIASTSSAKTLASEFFILKARLLLTISSENTTEAEALYQLAVNNAQEVQAPMLELRAVMGLGRLWQEQGKKEPAHTLLGNAYAKITEGFATADMKEASALLVILSE